MLNDLREARVGKEALRILSDLNSMRSCKDVKTDSSRRIVKTHSRRTFVNVWNDRYKAINALE